VQDSSRPAVTRYTDFALRLTENVFVRSGSAACLPPSGRPLGVHVANQSGWLRRSRAAGASRLAGRALGAMTSFIEDLRRFTTPRKPRSVISMTLALAGVASMLLFPSCGVEFCAWVPVLDSISPSSAQAGGPEFTLTLKGSRFHSDSSVLWDGHYLFGKTVNQNEIRVTVPADHIRDAGSAQVWVVNDPGGTNLNGPCGGGPSAKLAFTISQ